MTDKTLQDEINLAAAVASASTKAAVRSVAIGIIPILEFGLIIALTIMVVAAPVKIIQRMSRRGE